jgi:hypothetical protein
MIKTLDRQNVKTISEDVMDALKSVALKHGVQFSYKGGRFSSSNVTYKIEAAVVGDGGVVESSERKDFILYATSYGLKPEWLDTKFTQSGKEFTIVGLSTRKHKNPVLCKQTSNGKTYIFSAEMIKLYRPIELTPLDTL